MPSTETIFEYLAFALEATRGTAVTPPTHYVPLAGMIKPTKELYRPKESRGMKAEFYRSKAVRKGAEWSAEGGADPNYLPILFNMFVKGGVTAPTTPSGATLARLWSFPASMTADDLKSATYYWGDPNSQIFRSAFCVGEELTISSNADSTDGVTLSVKGMGHFPTKVSPPTLPAQNIGSLLIPGEMQLWIDEEDAIGTTEITGRVISTEWTIPTAVSYKYDAKGPGSDLNFSRTGTGARHATLKVTFELVDTTQYDQWDEDTLLKVRSRLNGDEIEDGFYEYVQMDIYGKFDALDWGELAGTNRTITLEIQSEYNATAGRDFALSVQNARTTL